MEWAYGFIYRIYASFKNTYFTEMLRMLWDNENSLLNEMLQIYLSEIGLLDYPTLRKLIIYQ